MKYIIDSEDMIFRIYTVDYDREYEVKGRFLGSCYTKEECHRKMEEYENNPVFKGTKEEYYDGNLV